MSFRPYENEKDRDAVHRIWRECGWLEDEQDAMDIVLGIGRRTVAEMDGAAECFVMTALGEMRHLDEDLPFSLVYAVTTSRVARKQGLAGRLTARCVAADAVDGALVSGLGAFELGYYDRLGFGTGGYDHMFEFDPAQLRMPDGLKVRPPKRLTAGDYVEMHLNRCRRRRCHVSCVFADDRTTKSEVEWGKHGFGLGYRDRPGGGFSHHIWLDTGGNAEQGPYRVRWMAYETREQLLELLGLIRNLGDQVRLVRMTEPNGMQLLDLLEQPTRMRFITKGSKLAQELRFMAWWQMRILDLEACLARTKLPLGPVSFNLRLSDPIETLLPEDAPWRGVGGDWIVTLGPASSAARGARADLPTMEASVNAFSRLWLGVRPASGLAVTDRLAAPKELLDELDRVVVLPVPYPDWDF